MDGKSWCWLLKLFDETLSISVAGCKWAIHTQNDPSQPGEHHFVTRDVAFWLALCLLACFCQVPTLLTVNSLCFLLPICISAVPVPCLFHFDPVGSFTLSAFPLVSSLWTFPPPNCAFTQEKKTINLLWYLRSMYTLLEKLPKVPLPVSFFISIISSW